MINLVSIAVGLLGVLAFVSLWSDQKKSRYHAVSHLTKEFVAAAQDVFSDEKIPESIKKSIRDMGPFIDDSRLARSLANRIDQFGGQGDDNELLQLDKEQAVKVVKAIFLFIIALSYSDQRSGWKIRDFILSNKAEQRVVPAGRLIYNLRQHPRGSVPQ